MYCTEHAAWAASASPSNRASIAAARRQSHMYLIPPDILDFVCSWSLLKENIVLAILVYVDKGASCQAEIHISLDAVCP